jgi:hypothetical protein
VRGQPLDRPVLLAFIHDEGSDVERSVPPQIVHDFTIRLFELQNSVHLRFSPRWLQLKSSRHR